MRWSSFSQALHDTLAASRQVRTTYLKIFLLSAVLCLSACTWFGRSKPPPPDPTELIVTGAPVGSTIVVDGVTIGQPLELSVHAQIVRVSPGPHVVEIHRGDPVVYREETEVRAGEKRVVTVLSGSPP